MADNRQLTTLDIATDYLMKSDSATPLHRLTHGLWRYDVTFSPEKRPNVSWHYMNFNPKDLKACSNELKKALDARTEEKKKCVTENRPYSGYIRVVKMSMHNNDYSTYVPVCDVASLKLMNWRNMTTYVRNTIDATDIMDLTIPDMMLSNTKAMSKDAFLKCITHRRGLKHVSHALDDVLWGQLGVDEMMHHQQQIVHVLKETRQQCLTYRENIHNISNHIIVHYMTVMTFPNDSIEFSKLCHSFHGSLVEAAVAGLQAALHNHMQLACYPTEVKRRCVAQAMERIFHIDCKGGQAYLKNQLDYRTAMYKILCHIMDNNGLGYGFRRRSTHAPLPLLALILKRAEQMNLQTFDLNTFVGGIMSQLDAMVQKMAVDQHQLETLYKMDNMSPLLLVDLRCKDRDGYMQTTMEDFM